MVKGTEKIWTEVATFFVEATVQFPNITSVS